MAKEPLPVFVFGCMSCGKTVAGNEDKCPRCGASFEEVTFECPFCGELVSPREKRCSECGTEFAEFAEEVLETAAIELDSTTSNAQFPASEVSKEELSYECPQCGAPLGEDDTKCPSCGARFA